MNDIFEIRLLRACDLPMLQTIARNTFIETFAKVNTTNNMAIYIEQQLSISTLEVEYNTENSNFYLLQWNNELVGYIKLNWFKNQENLFSSHDVEIERIYILQSFQGKKIGTRTLQWIQHQAFIKGGDSLWLGVWEHNEKALQFYIKQGFVVFGSHHFLLGHDVQTDLLMRKLLTG
ncbi:MAG: GNAT family N-acetyltransferase [Chitinophagaceae bacterium]|nr:GNAT family N-acetyltransferase [Chitinophagaceae bacterium]